MRNVEVVGRCAVQNGLAVCLLYAQRLPETSFLFSGSLILLAVKLFHPAPFKEALQNRLRGHLVEHGFLFAAA